MSTLTPRLDKLDKNYIINGGFDFWQRGSDWTGNVLSTDYRADRFLLYTDTGGAGNIKRTEDAPANTDIQYCAEFDMTSTPQDGDNRNHRHIHRIESVFSRSLKGKNLNLSFYYKTTDFTHVDIRLRVPTVRDNWSSATEISLTEYAIVDDGSWNRLTINIPSVANIEDGFEILIFTKFRSSAGATNWKITGVMLTEDSGTVQEFTRAGRDYAEELQLCQRYFEKSYDIDIAPGTLIGFGGTEGRVVITLTGTAAIQTKLLFNTRKRDTPVMSGFSQYANSSNADREFGTDPASTLLGFGNLSETGCEPAFNSNRVDTSRYSFQWTADAEL